MTYSGSGVDYPYMTETTLTQDQIELQAYLEAEKVKTEAWVAEDLYRRLATSYTTDISHWIKMGINSVADLVHYDLVSSVFEGTKERWGYKPNWSVLNGMTDEELNVELSSLTKDWE